MGRQIDIAEQRAKGAARIRNLNKRQKAAIIVRFLLNEGAELALSDLPETLQADLTQMMGNMRLVDRDTLAEVVMEFAAELESVGLAFPDGLGGAINALEGRISPHTAARLRKEAGVRQAGDPWDRIRALDTEALVNITDAESIEVSAVMLSKLDVAKAADLLGALPGEKARRIIYAVSQTGAITPDAVDRIGLTLAAQIDDTPPRVFAEMPEARVGEILNHSGSETRESVLSALQETDEGFASAVRRSIFTYADIPDRLEPRDVPAVLRAVDQGELIKALAFAKTDENGVTSEFLLSNTSSRLADQFREDSEDIGSVTGRDGETAMTAVVSTIRLMSDTGQIALRPSPHQSAS